MSRLALGTVQFGLAYGVANSGGQLPRKEAARILEFASSAGIDTLDTAIAYGESEGILGEIGINTFKVVTKIPPIPANISDVGGWVQGQIRSSLERLGVSSLYGVLLHRPADLTGAAGKKLVRALNQLQADEIVRKIGVSIYAPAELEYVFQEMAADIVQAPLNIIDRRLETSGWLKRLNDQSVEVHTRSAFLQGLLLMQRSAIPAKFERWSKIWEAWEQALAEKQISAISACLHYPMSLRSVSRVVVGVDSVSQLNAIVQSCSSPPPIDDFWDFMVKEDELLINPSKWTEL